ncbi:SDR family NAD(P)-dependent oxidoreductase [Actinacidiphila glaucinigra]|uniref:SDR family NAD(P)-dependent oxidoreductase n=1 Tax=Actinacidiphila glaucinigra TaxID=235986 RepID=UPI00324DF97D
MSVSSVPVVPPRTALVTGATSGIGWETARLLAERGCTVIVHGPDTESAHHAMERLVAGGIERVRLRLAVADFTRLSEVRHLAATVRGLHPALDVLVNNAAVAAPERHTLTADGHEISFQVNFLAAYLLTRELAGPLTARPGGRVVNVSSAAHRSAVPAWSDPHRSRRYSRHAAYARSQVALTVFTRAAAPAGVTAVSVHPGAYGTRPLPRYGHEGEPAAEGAARVARLCDPETELVPGAHYDRAMLAPAARSAVEDHAVRRLCRVADLLVTT